MSTKQNPREGEAAATPGRVLVTGAGGCVGAFIVDELGARGYPVTATDRPGTPPPAPRPGLVWAPADLTDPQASVSLCAGVEAVIHTAAWVDIHATFEEQAPINLDAVRYLYDAAAAAGVAYFLHFSTGSLYAPKDGPLTEDDALQPSSPYELAKLLAEDYLRTRPGPGPLVNLVRPALIYGPRGKVLLAPLATLPTILHLLDGWIPRLRGGPRTNIVHSADVARAAVHLLEHRQPALATFNVATREVLPAGDLLATTLRTAGMTHAALDLPFPGRLVRAVRPLLTFPRPFELFNRGARTLWRRLTRGAQLAGGLEPRVDMEANVYLSGDTVFDVTRLEATGFEFRFSTFEEGWADTFDWYRSHNWIPARPAHPSSPLLQQAA
ncbi:MAG TPA: NAD(P)-dependent oxidoreductase [Polyangia bacterium]|jgi:nucleoside-diphosphate-sugar epimerase